MRKGKGQLSYFGYILAIIGGIIMVIFSLLAMVSYAVALPFQSPIAGFFGAGIISLILGIIAVVLSKRVGELIFAIILAVVGFLGGGIGGLLVLIGGILGLIGHFV